MRNIQLVVCPSFVGGTPDGDPEGVHKLADQLLWKLISKGLHVTSIDVTAGIGIASPLLPTNDRIGNISKAGFIACVVRDFVRQVLIGGDLPVVIGGDHSIAIGTVSAALSMYGRELGLVWFDQHPDMHTFESSMSKRAHGMGLRVILGDGHPELLRVTTGKIDPRRVVHVGATDIEPGEDVAIDHYGRTGALFLPHALSDHHHELLDLRLTEFEIADTPVHFELDVDVTNLAGVPISCRNAEGVTVAHLEQVMTSKFKRSRMVSMGISEYVGNNDHDQTADKVVSLISRFLT